MLPLGGAPNEMAMFTARTAKSRFIRFETVQPMTGDYDFYKSPDRKPLTATAEMMRLEDWKAAERRTSISGATLSAAEVEAEEWKVPGDAPMIVKGDIHPDLAPRKSLLGSVRTMEEVNRNTTYVLTEGLRYEGGRPAEKWWRIETTEENK